MATGGELDLGDAKHQNTGGEVSDTKHQSTVAEVSDTKDLGTEVVQEYTCGVCNKGGRITEASHYCPECDTCYCKACLCDHDVIGRSGVKRWGIGKGSAPADVETKDVNNEEMCLKHDNVKVELYCKDHDVVFCSLCLSTTHRTCANTTKLTKLETDESVLGNNQKRLQDDTKALSKRLDTLHRERTIKQKVLKRSHDEYISNVESFRRLVNQTFDSISKDGDKLKQEYDLKFEADKVLCEHGKAKQVKLLQILERSTVQTFPFTFLKKWNEWVNIQMQLLQEMHSADVKTDFKLIAENDIQTTIGYIERLGEKKWGYPVCCVTQLGDKEVCDIVGICQLANGNMILADASNKKLKLLDDTYTIVSSYIYEDEATPVAVCTVGETEIAVAMNNKTVQMVNVDKTFKVSATIQLAFECSDIEALNDEFFILSSCLNTTNTAFGAISFGGTCTGICGVHVYSTTGNPVRKTNVHCYGQYLTLTGDAGEMYVTHGSKLYYCNSKGETLASHTINNGINSVCLDDSGLIYLSSTNGNKLYTITRDGNRLSKLTELQVETPTALCWDRRIGRLVVGCQKRSHLYLV